MAELSVFMIARNEEKNLRRSLGSVAWAKEKIVVDSGSSDATAALAKELGARVAARPFTNYAEQKNHAMELCGGEWVLSLDADEEVTPSLAEEIRKTLERPSADAYRIGRRSFIFGRAMRFTGTQDDKPVRLWRKGAGEFQGSIHETVTVTGRTGTLKGRLNHYTYPSLSSYLERLNRYTSMEAERLRGRRRPGGLTWRPLAMFLRLYFWKLGFLDGVEGFVFSWLSAYYVFVKHAKALEK